MAHSPMRVRGTRRRISISGDSLAAATQYDQQRDVGQVFWIRYSTDYQGQS